MMKLVSLISLLKIRRSILISSIPFGFYKSNNRLFIKALVPAFILMFFLGALNSQAATITSTLAGGVWGTATTWVGGAVPLVTDDVIIVGPVTVGADVNQTTGTITINSGGTLTVITNGRTLTAGALTINSGGVLTISQTLTVTGTTNITGTINLQGTARSHAFNDIILNSGAVWNETINNTPTISGSFTNNASTFTASTGLYTFSGTTKTLSGATTTAIPTATFTGTYTNSGTFSSSTLLTVTSPGVLTNNATVTATTALSGTGGLTQGATGILNLGGTSGITTLNASTNAGNTVNYTGASQAVKAITYSNLTINGSGTATIGGATTVNATMTVTSAVTNNNTLTVTTALSGASTLTQGAGSTLNIGGTSGITTLDASTNANTVNYTGAAQTVKDIAYSSLGFSGTGTKTWTLGANRLVNATLTVGAGTTFVTVGNFTLGVTGATSVSGTLTLGGSGTKTFTGAVTVNSGGVWDLSGSNPGTSFGGGITNNSATTLNNGSGAAAFSANQSLAGTGAMTFGGSVTPASTFTLTNNNASTVSIDNIVLSGNFTQGSNAPTLALVNTAPFSGLGTFNASTNPNTVNYTGAAQTVRDVAYSSLGFSGSGTKTWTLGANRLVNATLTVGAGTTFVTAGTFTLGVTGATSVSGTLNLGGSGTITFTGAVTVNSGGIWNLSGSNPGTSFGGGITNNSATTFNNGSGAAAFSANQSLAGTGAMTFGGSVTPASTFTLTNNNASTVTIDNIVLTGNFTQGSNTPTLALVNTAPFSGAGTFNASTNPNTVNYTGGAQTVKEVNYSTLGLSGSGAKTLQTTTTTISGNFNLSGTATTTGVVGLTIGGTVTLGLNTTFTAGAFTHNVGGDWVNNGSGTFTNTGSTINFNRPGAQSIGGSNSTTFNNLTLAVSGTKTFSSTVPTITAGALSISTGVVADLGTLTTHTANTLSLGGLGQINGTWGGTGTAANINTTFFAATSGYVDVSISTCATGTWLGTTNTDWHTATNWSCSVIPTAATNVTIPSGGNQPVIGAVAVANNITINSGAFLTINGTNTLTVSGDWTNSGTFTANTSTVTFNGVGKTITGATTFHHVTLSGSATVTTAAAVIMNGNLTIANSTTFTAAAFALTVTGTTTVGGGASGNLTISSATGTKIFTGLVTVASGGTWTNTAANAPVTFRGGITNSGSGAFNAGTGLHTFDTNAQALTGTLVIPSVTVTVTVVPLTNNGTLTINTALSGSGSLSNNGTLNIGGTSSITTLTNSGTTAISGSGAISTALANFTNTGTINISGSGLITGITNNASGIVNHSGSSTISSFNNATATSTLSISTTPTVPTITTLTVTAPGNTVNYSGGGNQTIINVGYSNLIISGSGVKAIGAALVVNGNLTITSATYNASTLTTTVTGLTTVSGGTYSAGSALQTFTGGLTINGGTFAGSGPVSAAGVTLSSGTLTAPSGAFNVTGLGNWTYSGGTFTPGANTVTFNGTNQTIGGSTTTFNNLVLSTSGTKTFNVLTIINGNLTISGTAVALLADGTTSTAATLTLGGVGQGLGLWGGTGSPATFKNATYFGTTTTGILNVSTGSCSSTPNVNNPISVTASGTDIGNTNGSTVTIRSGKLTAGISYKIFYTVTKVATGTIISSTVSTAVTGTGTSFTTELSVGSVIVSANTGAVIGTVALIGSNTSLTLTANAALNHNAAYHSLSITSSKDVTFLAGRRTQGSFTTGQINTIGQYKVYINSIAVNSTGCSSPTTLSANFQVITAWATTQPGLWDNPATWGNTTGTGPDFNNGLIRVRHAVYYDTTAVSLALEVDELVIENGAILTIYPEAVLTIKNGVAPVSQETDLEIQGTGKLQIGLPLLALINGTLNFEQGVTHTGTSTTGVEFILNSLYKHLSTTSEGSPPLATWAPTSTFSVLGYTTANGLFASNNWNQNFGNFIWNCPNQTGSINLNGKLAGNIQGDLTLASTGNTSNTILRLADADGPYSLTIVQDLIVSGSARFATGPANGNGPDATITMRNLVYSSTLESWLSDAGLSVINVLGDVQVNSGILYFSQKVGSPQRSGTTVNLSGNLLVASGATLDGSDANNDRRGTLIFTTSATNFHTYTILGSIQGWINYIINSGQTVRAVGESAFISTATGTTLTPGNSLYGLILYDNAKLIVESTQTGGAIQAVPTLPTTVTGNIRVLSTSRYFAPGSIIEYGRTTTAAGQYISSGHTITSGVNCIINNSSGVIVSSPPSSSTVTIGGNLTIQSGNLFVTENNLTVQGNLQTLNTSKIFVNTKTLSAGATALTINGAIDLAGGGIDFTSSATVNASNTELNINGDLQGSNFFTFFGANCQVTVGGIARSFARDFPISSQTSLEYLTINFASGTVTPSTKLNIPQNLIVGNTSTNIGGLRIRNGNLSMNAGTTLTVTSDAKLFNGIVYFNDANIDLKRNVYSGNPTSLGGSGLFSSNTNSTLSLTSSFSGTPADSLGFVTNNILGTLTLNRSHNFGGQANVQLLTSLIIDKFFYLTDGQFFAPSGLSMSAGATIVRTPQASFYTGSGIPGVGPYHVIYNNFSVSDNSLTSGVELQGSLNNVTSNLTGTGTLTSAITGIGTLTVNSGVFTCVGFPVNMGSVLIAAAGTLNAPAGSNLTLTGNFTNNGIFNAGSGTSYVVFDGTSTISGSATTNFHHLTLNASRTLSVPTLIQVKGHIVFNTGSTFNHSNGNVELNGTGPSPSGNDGELNQNITASNSVAAFPQTLAMNATSAAGNAKFWTITVNKPGVVGSVNLLVDELRLGQLLDIKSATAINTNDKLVLLSQTESTPLDARIGPIVGAAVGATITGNVQAQRFMGSTAYALFRYMASPVNNGAIPTLVVDKLYYWVGDGTGGSTGQWVRTFDPMPTGQGYAALSYSPSDSRWSVQGPVKVGSHNWPVGTFRKGWNLVGNPYPAPIKWSALELNWGIDTNYQDGNVLNQSISTVAAITDNNIQGYPAYFRYAAPGYTGSGSGKDNIFGEEIAMGQAFWVYAFSDNATLTINETAKASNSNSQAQFYRESGVEAFNGLTLSINNGIMQDQAFLKIDRDATEAFDRNKDLPKLWNEEMNVFIVDGGKQEMVIQSIPVIQNDKNIPVGLKVSKPGEYQFQFSFTDDFTYRSQLYLVDQYEEVAIPVSDGVTYSFTLQAGITKLTDRFLLTLNPQFEYNAEARISVFPNPVTNFLQIETYGAKQSSFMTLTDLNGKTLKSKEFMHTFTVDMSEFKAGMYILQVQTEKGIVIKKILKND